MKQKPPKAGPVIVSPNMPTVRPVVKLPNYVPPVVDPTGRLPASKAKILQPQNQNISVAGENAILPEAFGRCLITKPRIFAIAESGSSVVLGLAWCRGEITTINAFYAGNEAFTGTVTHYLGTAGQTANSTLSSAIAGYTDALAGIVYSVVVMSEEDIRSGISFSIDLEGRKLYDPRTTLTAATENFALMYRYVATEAGLTVDNQSIIDAANYCDETVGSYPRWNGGLLFDQPMSINDQLALIAEYAGCYHVRDAGTAKLVPDTTTATSATFSDVQADIDGGAGMIVAGSLRLRKKSLNEIPNQTSCQYLDPTQVPWRSSYAETADPAGDLRLTTFKMPGFRDYNTAYRFAEERQNRFDLVDLNVDFEAFDEGLPVQVGDVVEVTHNVGLTSKKIRVLDVQAGRDIGHWVISGENYDATVYSDTTSTEPTWPDITLPKAWDIPEGPAATVAEVLFLDETERTHSRFLITFDGLSWPYMSAYRVKVADGTDVVLEQVIAHIGDGVEHSVATAAVTPGVEYTIEIWAINVNGKQGATPYPPATKTAVGNTDIPTAPTSLTATTVPGGVLLEWSLLTMGTVSHVEVWGSETNNRDYATLLTRTLAGSYFHELTAAAVRYYWVLTVSETGLESTWEPVSSSAGVSGTAGTGGVDGDDAVLYYIKPTAGTAIKNGTGELTVEAHKVTGGTDELLSSGTIKLYVGTTEVTVANSYATGSDGYIGVFDTGDIAGDVIVELKDGPAGTILDTVTLVDIDDGAAGDDALYGYITASGPLSWTRASDQTTWTPAGTTVDLTATFVQAGSTVAEEVWRVTRDADGILTGAVQTNDPNVTTVNLDASSQAMAVKFTCIYGGQTAVVSETVITSMAGTTAPVNYLGAWASFETSPDVSGVGTFAAVPWIGTQALEVTSSALNTFVSLGTGSTDYHFNIPAKQKWVLSAYVRVSSTNSPLTSNNVNLHMRTAAAGDYYNLQTSVAADDAYHRIEFPIDLTAATGSNDASTTCVILVQADSYSGSGATTMYFDGVQLELDDGSGTAREFSQPALDGVDGAAGADGADGVAGDDGVSIVFQGSFASAPGSPQNGWSYYNTTDGKSYVYQDSTWYQMTIDGVDGANGDDGLSIVWHGDAATPDPSWAILNHVYRDTDNGYVYIYNGSAWELMVLDGNDGAAGTDGTDGFSVYITYSDNAVDNEPAVPTGDGTTGEWGTTPSASSNWMSQKVSETASSGTWGAPILITGADGADGADGSDGSTGISTFHAPIYKRKSTPITTPPSGGSFNFGTNVLTPPATWETSVPSGTDPIYTCSYQFSIVGDTGEDTAGTWSAVTVLAQDGADGATGDAGLSTYAYTVYRREASAPSTPTGGSYNFTTNTGTPPTDWSNTIPASDGNPCYASTAVASVSGPTGTDSSLTWSTPAIMVRDGSGGAVNYARAYASFENSPTTFDGANATSSYEAVPWIGGLALKVIAEGAAGTFTTFTFLGSSNSDYHMPIPANQNWVLSAYVRLETTPTPVTSNNVQLFIKTSAGNTYTVTGSVTNDGAYHRIQGALDLTGDASTTAILRVDNDSYLAANTTMYFDGLQLEIDDGTGTAREWVQPALDGADAVDGAAGTDARAVNLTIADQTIEYDTNNANPDPSSATVTATALNTTGTVYYEFFKNDVSVQNTTSNTYAYVPPASYTSMPEKIEVQIREGAGTGDILARDQITVSGLKAGTDAVTIIVSNEAHTLPTTNGGVVTYTGSGTDFEVWIGTTQVPYDGTAAYASPSYRISVTDDTNITVGSASTVATYTRRYGVHSNMTADTASITFAVTVKDAAGVENTYTKTQTLAKSNAGEDGLSIALSKPSAIATVDAEGYGYILGTDKPSASYTSLLYSGGTMEITQGGSSLAGSDVFRQAGTGWTDNQLIGGTYYSKYIGADGLTLWIEEDTGVYYCTVASGTDDYKNWTGDSLEVDVTATYDTNVYTRTYNISKAFNSTSRTAYAVPIGTITRAVGSGGASIKYDSNGFVYINGSALAEGEWLKNGTNTDYEVRAVTQSGTDPDGVQPLNELLGLGTDRTFTLDAVGSCLVTISLYRASSGVELSSYTYNLVTT